MTISDLTGIRVLRLKIEGTTERIARLRSSMTTLQARYANNPGRGTPKRDRIGEQLARLEELELQLADEVIEFEVKFKGVDAGLERLPEAQQAVLRCRYFDGKRKWKDIAAQLNYSEDHCIRLHREAVSKMPENVG